MKRCLAILVLLCCFGARAAEVIPPAPDKYFNDYAHVTSAATASRLNQQLEDFEKQTSSQIVVAVFPKMQSDSSIEAYAVQVYRAWKIGQKGKDNGALLLVFVQDHKMNITTGYGLEGALPDVICKRIIDDEIAPHFKANDYNGGLDAGVNSMIAAAKGEYKGTGRTVADKAFGLVRHSSVHVFFWAALILFFLIISLLRMGYRPGHRYRYGDIGWSIFQVVSSMLLSGGWSIGSDRDRRDGGGGWSGGGGGGWSGGGGGGEGGGFSGGGGSSGGGGASGSW